MKAVLKWTSGLQFVAQTEETSAIVLDSSDGKSGPTPMQMVLMGVAGCTAMDVVYIMKKKRADLTDFQIVIYGTMAEEHPKRFTDIEIEYLFYGNNLKEKDAQKAIELSEQKYCSAAASINANITNSFKIFTSEEANG